MSVHSAVAARLGGAAGDGAAGRLPDWVKLDRTSVHGRLLRRLAARTRVGGQAAGAGVGGTAGAGPLAARQRVVVKAMVSRHASGRSGGGLLRHLGYLARAGAGVEGERAEVYGPVEGRLEARGTVQGWSQDRHHFRLIVSPEHGDRLGDLKGYVRSTMQRIAGDLKAPGLEWLAVNHFDTDQPHAHVLIRGRRPDGRDLVVPRSYMAHGFRLRAEDSAQDRLGELGRSAAEQRVWREAGADRFTRLDRELLDAAARGGGLLVAPGGRPGSYDALMRGRLAHLQRLGLAARTADGVRLAPDLEMRLRTLRIRADLARALNQRRLEGAERVRMLGDRPVRGQVVRSGFHDALRAEGYVLVRAASGDEYYARLRLGAAAPRAGASVALHPAGPGQARVTALDRGLSAPSHNLH